VNVYLRGRCELLYKIVAHNTGVQNKTTPCAILKGKLSRALHIIRAPIRHKPIASDSTSASIFIYNIIAPALRYKVDRFSALVTAH
jgi:hypothetical protein